MRVFLLNAPFLPKYSRSQRSPAVTKSGTLYYPYWLAYATGVLEREGHQAKLVDAAAANYDVGDVMREADELRPELIVLDTSTASFYTDVETGEALKARFPGSKLVMVGTHVSATPEESLERSREILAVTRKEYDYTLRDLVTAIEGGTDLTKVDGITFRGDDGTIVHNPDRPMITDLDELPFVAEVYKRHLDPWIESYFYAITRYPVMSIISGRGCPFKCTYCLYPQTMHGHSYRYRSVENVVAEFEYIKYNFPQIAEIFVEDDTLTVNKKRCRELSGELIRRNVNMTFTCNSRADVDAYTLQLLKKAGCRLLCVGVESADQQILDNVQKRITLDKIRAFVKDAKSAGLMIHGCFMVGNPGETRETLQKTLAFAKELNPDTAQFFPLMVYPGTKAYEWAKEQGYLSTTRYDEWLTPDGLHNSVVQRPDLSHEELVDFCDEARRQFYFRPAYIGYKLRQSATSWREAKRTAKSFKTFLPYLMRRSLAASNKAGDDERTPAGSGAR
ncbi:MAG TPA: radical SAM protein [Dehalococcoidia bacterium]|nr:radical SAM protein [Dehalococcoidia bacterium]